MDRYRQEGAARRVLDYFLPRPHEEAIESGKSSSFARAKADTIRIIEQVLADVKTLEQDDFFAMLKGGKLQGLDFLAKGARTAGTIGADTAFHRPFALPGLHCGRFRIRNSSCPRRGGDRSRSGSFGPKGGIGSKQR